jgi:hypothetical protein
MHYEAGVSVGNTAEDLAIDQVFTNTWLARRAQR